MNISQLLAFSVKNQASDLHLSAGLAPMLRVHGQVCRINVEPLSHAQVTGMLADTASIARRWSAIFPSRSRACRGSG